MGINIHELLSQGECEVGHYTRAEIESAQSGNDDIPPVSSVLRFLSQRLEQANSAFERDHTEESERTLIRVGRHYLLFRDKIVSLPWHKFLNGEPVTNADHELFSLGLTSAYNRIPSVITEMTLQRQPAVLK